MYSLAQMGLIFFGICLLVVPVTAVATNCTMRTRGTFGQLICQFSVNVEREYNFLIQRQSLDGTETAETVVECWRQKPQGHYCKVASGYEFDEKVWNILIVDMPILSQRHEGKYVCQVTGNGDPDDNPCFFKYKGGNAVAAANREQKAIDAVLDHSVSELTLLSIVLVAVLVHFAVWVLYVWKHRAVGTDGRNAQQNPHGENGSIPNPPARNDAELEQRFSKMEQEIRQIPQRVYEMTTDSTATLLKQLQNLPAKLDTNQRLPIEKSFSGDEDETLHKAEVTDPLMSQPSSSKSPPSTPRHRP